MSTPRSCPRYIRQRARIFPSARIGVRRHDLLMARTTLKMLFPAWTYERKAFRRAAPVNAHRNKEHVDPWAVEEEWVQ